MPPCQLSGVLSQAASRDAWSWSTLVAGCTSTTPPPMSSGELRRTASSQFLRFPHPPVWKVPLEISEGPRVRTIVATWRPADGREIATVGTEAPDRPVAPVSAASVNVHPFGRSTRLVNPFCSTFPFCRGGSGTITACPACGGEEISAVRCGNTARSLRSGVLASVVA